MADEKEKKLTYIGVDLLDNGYLVTGKNEDYEDISKSYHATTEDVGGVIVSILEEAKKE